jgi:thymidylate kinase
MSSICFGRPPERLQKGCYDMRIVLEGLPGSGKSTHALMIGEFFNCPVIPEFAGFSAMYWIKHKLRSPFYRVNDEVKEFLAKQFESDMVIFDRHYVSTLGFSYTLDKFKNINRLTDERYSFEMNWYLNCRMNEILTPADIVIIIDIPSSTSIERKPSAREFDPIFGVIECLDCMKSYYVKFYEMIEPEVKVIWIDGTKEEDKVFRKITQIISENNI